MQIWNVSLNCSMLLFEMGSVALFCVPAVLQLVLIYKTALFFSSLTVKAIAVEYLQHIYIYILVLSKSIYHMDGWMDGCSSPGGGFQQKSSFLNLWVLRERGWQCMILCLSSSSSTTRKQWFAVRGSTMHPLPNHGKSCTTHSDPTPGRCAFLCRALVLHQ